MNRLSSLSALRPARGAMRTMFGGLLVAAAALAAQPALAQGGPHMGPGGHGRGGDMMFGGSPRHMERMLDSVGATDAQRAAIRQIAEQARADLKTQRDAGRALHQQMRQLLTAPAVEPGAVEALRQQMLAHHDAVSKVITAAMVKAASVLTPEQRAQIGERMAKREQRMLERMQQHRDAAPKS